MKKLSALKFRKSQNSFADPKNEEPIRAELFSVERLEQFAVWFAAEQQKVSATKFSRNFCRPRHVNVAVRFQNRDNTE